MNCCIIGMLTVFNETVLGGPGFWLAWAIATAGMLREARQLRRPDLPRSAYGLHFSRQVQLGALLLLGLILAGRG